MSPRVIPVKAREAQEEECAGCGGPHLNPSAEKGGEFLVSQSYTVETLHQEKYIKNPAVLVEE